MEKPQNRHWKEVHRSGVQSNSSLNSSFNSNHSSASAGYNRFQFQRTSTDKDPKRPQMFQFTARNKDNPHDVSILTRQHQHTARTPQARTQPEIASLTNIFRRMSTLGFEKDTKKVVAALLKEVGAVMEMLKSTVEQFKKQYRELKWEWNRSIKGLAEKELALENSQLQQLRKRLAQKELELEKLGKETSSWRKDSYDRANGGDGGDGGDRMGSRDQLGLESRGEAGGSWLQSPLRRLNISKVDPGKNPQTLSKLSRNNTLQSLLGPDPQEPSLPANPKPISRPSSSAEVCSLRQRLSRMREVLGC